MRRTSMYGGIVGGGTRDELGRAGGKVKVLGAQPLSPWTAHLRRALDNPVVQWAILGGICLAAYWPALGRYFVSEDFFVLRQLAASTLGETTWTNLTGPLLDISFVKFYRPVAAMLIQVEFLLWGVAPMPYHLSHLAIHVVNAMLVYRLAHAWSGGSRGSAAGVAALFAVYPLHTNSIIFVAAFATVYSATAVLATLVLYEKARERAPAARTNGLFIASLTSFAVALGTYEQPVILPLLLLVRELLAVWDNSNGQRWRLRSAARTLGRWAVRRWLPYLAVLVSYFLARTAALGEVLAGYPGFRRRVVSADIFELGERILRATVQMIWPEYDYRHSSTALAAIGLVLVLGTVGTAWLGGIERRLWMLGLAWMLVTQAPFAFEGVVPGNGRYWYLTSIGLGLMVVAVALTVARGLSSATRKEWVGRSAAVILVAGMGGYYLVLLDGYVGTYDEASRLSKVIQEGLVEQGEAGDERIFAAGCPDFLKGGRGVPVAQVFHWGLHDALRLPFVDRGPDVYPLPPLADGALHPITVRSDLGTAVRWHQDSTSFEHLPAPSSSAGAEIETRVTGSGALQFRSGTGRYRLVLLTRGGASMFWVEEKAAPGVWVDAAIPEPVVRNMGELYGGAIFAWIEERDGKDFIGASKLVQLNAR